MARTYATPAAIITICILFPVLGIIAVLLRFYTRRRAKLPLWLDDWLAIPALLLELVLAGLLIWGATTRSLGDVLPPPNVPGPDGYLFSTSDRQVRLLQIQYYADIVTIFAFGFTKLSILFFYRNIFCSRLIGRTLFGTVTTAMIVLVTVWTFGFGIGAIFVCGGHPDYGWGTVAVITQKCKIQIPLIEGYAISDFIMDVMIWSLPLPRIWTLKVTLFQKVGVILVFLVGLLAIAASAARMAIYIKYIVNAFAQADGETLVTYLLFWTMIECGLGIIVICLPVLRPLYGKLFSSAIRDNIKRATWRSKSRETTRSSTTRGSSRGNSLTPTTSYTQLSRSWGDARVKTSIYGGHEVDRKYSLQASMDMRDDIELQSGLRQPF